MLARLLRLAVNFRPFPRIDSKLIASGLLLIALILLAAYANSHRKVEVLFTAQASAPGRLQVFHDGEGRFSEAGSQWFDLQGGKPVEGVQAIGGGDAAQLRFDPPAGATTTLCGLRVGRSGSSRQYEILSIEDVSLIPGPGCLTLQAGRDARDPRVTLAFAGHSLQKIKHARVWRLVFYTASAALLLFLWWTYRFRLEAIRRWLAAAPMPRWLEMLDRKAHWICAAMLLLFGTAYVFGTPPGAVPDEQAHLAKIIRISEGMPFGGHNEKLLPAIGGMYGPFNNYLKNKAAFTDEQLNTQLNKKLVCEGVTTNLPRQADGYFPHQYLLPSAAFKASCATGASFGVFLYSARLLNLLLSMALVFFALRHAERGKWALFTVALLPMSLFQMSSLSADSLTISLSIAWLGLVSGIYGRKVTLPRALPMLWVLGLAIALLKPGAAWILVCLVFCKPAFDDAGRSFNLAMLKFVALPWVIHVAWTVSTANQAGALAGVDATVNAHSLRADPLVFVHAWFNTFFSEHARALAKMLVGVLGWLDVPLSPWAYPAGGVALLASLWTNQDSTRQMPSWTAPLALALAAGSLVMIALPLFIYWSPVGIGYVQGLQGRYFIATVAFVLVWCSFRSLPSIRALHVSAIIILVASINLDALYMLHRAYFVVGRA